MARTGVSKDQVFEAASALLDEGLTGGFVKSGAKLAQI